MDQSETAKQFEERAKKNTHRFLVILMAALATLLAILAIAPRWGAFTSIAKFDAILLLIILVSSPVFELLAEKGGQVEHGRFRASITGYVLIMLSILLFARPFR